MSRLAVLDGDGAAVGIAALSEALAAQEIKPHLIHEVVVAEMAARRAGTHSTKNRGEVRGGGRKPWRQKGTGRARQGSIRAPQWTGGGIVFGPTPRSYGGKVNRKIRQQAFRSALRAHAERGSAAVMESVGWDEPSTKRAAAYLAAAPAELAGGSVLVVVASLDGVVARSFRNLARVRVMTPVQVQTTELMQARALLVEREIWERMAGGPLEVEPAAKPKRAAKPKARAAADPAPAEPAEPAAEAPEPVAQPAPDPAPDAAVADEAAPADDPAPAADAADAAAGGEERS